MLGLVLDFVSCLRAGDVRVSTAEVLDCVQQLGLIDPLIEDEFRTTLKANFVKSRREQPKFDRLYNLFFHDLGSTEENQADVSPLDFVRALKEAQPLGEIQAAIMDFLSGNPIELLEILQRIQTEQATPQVQPRALGRPPGDHGGAQQYP